FSPRNGSAPRRAARFPASFGRGNGVRCCGPGQGSTVGTSTRPHLWTTLGAVAPRATLARTAARSSTDPTAGGPVQRRRVLRPDAPLLRRAPGEVQVGTDPRWSVRLA